MLPFTRARLERNLAYYEQLVKYYQDAVDKDKNEGEEGEHEEREDDQPEGEEEQEAKPQGAKDEAKPWQAPKPKADDKKGINRYQLRLNQEVVKQIRDVLAADPIASGIETAMENRPVVRNIGGDLKPMAGRFTTPRPRVFH